MSPEAQRIAIAEACGFRRIRQLPTIGGFRMIGELFTPWDRSPGSGAWCERDVPDYLSDLNAMHEAEKVLPLDKVMIYACAISRVLGIPPLCDRTWHEIGMVARATAAQRAEAFLRTLGKWEDGK